MEKEDTTNANTNDHSDQNKLLPMTQWALDPVFYATAKLSIRAILQAPQYYDFNNIINYYGHAVARVEIAGIIVALRGYVDKSKMWIDDGTGVILCNKWNNNNPATDLFEVGDFVVIRGRIHYYQQREVTVYRMRGANDPNEEPLHWLQVIKLTETVYKQLPDMHSYKSKKITLKYKKKT
jgi:RPA family protein